MAAKIYIVRVGDVEGEILEFIRGGVEEAFNVESIILDEKISLPKEAYSRLRMQYLSEPLLDALQRLAIELNRKGEGGIVLGVTNADIYAPGMNFIFGEARCPGVAAIISLFRLRPESYGGKPDKGLLIERAIKEAIHELGHAFGLRHCGNPLCVMHFSLHIGMTDRKLRSFCEDCRRKLRYAEKRGRPNAYLGRP